MKSLVKGARVLTGLPPGKIHLQCFSGDEKWHWIIVAGEHDVTVHADGGKPPKLR